MLTTTAVTTEKTKPGHFRLTSLLMPALLKSPDARVVSVSSSAHLFASTVEWDDLNAAAPGAYAPWKAYGLSKLSNIYFTKALQRRVDSKGGTNACGTNVGVRMQCAAWCEVGFVRRV